MNDSIEREQNKHACSAERENHRPIGNDFMTPPKHVNFRAKKLFGEMGRIVDGSVAYIELNGGGPTELHTHVHNHLFIVTEGDARIQLGEETVIIHKDEALLVEGRILLE